MSDAIKEAIEAMDKSKPYMSAYSPDRKMIDKAIAALQALQSGEPSEWVIEVENGQVVMSRIGANFTGYLYTTPQPVADRQDYNTWSNSDGDTWLESPKDIEFVHGLKVGDTYELLAGWVPVLVEYRVTKAPDDADDDYEVELLPAGKENNNAIK
jgi:hypothetical protein